MTLKLANHLNCSRKKANSSFALGEKMKHTTHALLLRVVSNICECPIFDTFTFTYIETHAHRNENSLFSIHRNNRIEIDYGRSRHEPNRLIRLKCFSNWLPKITKRTITAFAKTVTAELRHKKRLALGNVHGQL